MNVLKILITVNKGVPTLMDHLSVPVTLATCSMQMDTHANVEAFSTKPVAGSPHLAGQIAIHKKTSSVNG